MLDGPLPDYAFSRDGHDRLAERRRDERFLEAAWGDERSRVVVMRQHGLAVESGGRSLHLVSPQDAPAGQRMLLGSVGDIVHFLVLADECSLDGSGGVDSGGEFGDLRGLASQLDEDQSGLAVHAVSLGGWHRRHPRCSVCGAPTDVADAGASRQCPECSTQHFPRTDPAVIMLVVDDADRCLLGHNSARSEGWYSTLAGFVEPGESPEQAVRREVMEETGVAVGAVRYAGSQPWPFPSSLMLGYFADATTTDICVDGDEITAARWFTRSELARGLESAELVVPTRISIAGALLSAWYGDDLPISQAG
ncbi:MAG: NAD(+) diphosphatase [Propionibacteriales bacterium]|nr:NAD(+) diphosphatase [Propionibacteriales bacterium]